jgi:hypothetical protein
MSLVVSYCYAKYYRASNMYISMQQHCIGNNLREFGLLLPGYFVCWAGVQSMLGVLQSDQVDSRTGNHQLSQMVFKWSGNPDS